MDRTPYSPPQLWWRGQFDLVRWISAALAALLSGMALVTGAVFPSVVFGGLAGALIGAIVLGEPINALILKRRLRKSPFNNNSLIFRLSETDIHVVGNNEDTHLKWSAFSKARRFPDGILLYQGPQFFSWLPDSAAADEASISVARDLVKSQVKDYRDV